MGQYVDRRLVDPARPAALRQTGAPGSSGSGTQLRFLDSSSIPGCSTARRGAPAGTRTSSPRCMRSIERCASGVAVTSSGAATRPRLSPRWPASAVPSVSSRRPMRQPMPSVATALWPSGFRASWCLVSPSLPWDQSARRPGLRTGCSRRSPVLRPERSPRPTRTAPGRARDGHCRRASTVMAARPRSRAAIEVARARVNSGC